MEIAKIKLLIIIFISVNSLMLNAQHVDLQKLLYDFYQKDTTVKDELFFYYSRDFWNPFIIIDKSDTLYNFTFQSFLNNKEYRQYVKKNKVNTGYEVDFCIWEIYPDKIVASIGLAEINYQYFKKKIIALPVVNDYFISLVYNESTCNWEFSEIIERRY